MYTPSKSSTEEAKIIVDTSSSVGILSEKNKHRVHGGRMCEEAFVGRIKARSFALCEKKFPVWLFCLKYVYVESLWVVGIKSARDFL